MVLALHLSQAVFGQNFQQPGVYVEQNGAWISHTPAAYSGVQGSNKIVKATFSWTFRGAHVPLQLSASHLHFLLVCGPGGLELAILCQPGTSQPVNLLIVRLDEKSDHRESRTISGTMFGAKSGFDPKKTVTAAVLRRADGNWDVSPSQDLKSGEYLLTVGSNPQGFDFGIRIAEVR